MRSYVDGNGGNISCRIGEKYVLCTPTLLSKADLTPDDICLVDFEGNQVAGRRKRTSEVILHLEIYKAQPKARACIHAHPPHATAYAIIGMVPPERVIPEAEVFVGCAAFAPYGTPGTIEIARKVVELVADHNTILLGNHGVVCWADTVTHAEWCIEVIDTYCQTLIIASQLGAPIKTIPQDKFGALLDVKRKLDLPDPRLSGRECTLSDMPDNLTSITVCPGACDSGAGPCRLQGTKPCPRSGEGTPDRRPDDGNEALISRIADEVMKALKK
jgi:L-fuculose-phosphate aldolase